MPAQHVFAQVLSGMVSGGVKISSIRFVPSEVDGRATLTACGILRIEDAVIDGIEMPSATVEARLHVVEYANFVYVIQTRLVDGIAKSEIRRAEIDQIIRSFRATSAANAVEREKADEADADKSFEQMMKESAGDILILKAKALIGGMIVPDRPPRVTDQQLEAVKMLERYAIAFPDYVSEEQRESLKVLRECAQEALDGQPAGLAEFIEFVLSEETDPELGAADPSIQ